MKLLQESTLGLLHSATTVTLVAAREPSFPPTGQSQQRIVLPLLVQPHLFWASTTYQAQMMPLTQTGNLIVPLGHRFSIRKEVSVTTIVHPNYDTSTTNNDIALLKLAEAVDLSIYTPACLPASSADYVGQTAKVYGGKIFLPPILFQVGAGRTLAGSQRPQSCWRRR